MSTVENVPRSNRKSAKEEEEAEERKDSDLAVVAIGASAGGLTALRDFFNVFPPDPSIAFIIITHLDPRRESHMVEILGRYSDRAVQEPKDQEALIGGNVYMIPPGKNLVVSGGRLNVLASEHRPGVAMPVDILLRSLAKDQRERAIGIILSGTGSDGCLGVKEVKAEGGLVIVQEPSTAEHDGMPRAAIATGVA